MIKRDKRNDREIWEDNVFKNAVYFTLIRYLGGAKYDRAESGEFRACVDHVRTAPKDHRLMIYAVDHTGASNMIAPKDYDRYLAAK